MKAITEYYIEENEARVSSETRLKHEIKEVDGYRFYLGFKGDDRKHYELNIFVERRWDEGDGTFSEWEDQNENIQFYMSNYGMPTLEQFQEHIIKEMKAIIHAMDIEVVGSDGETLKYWADNLFLFDYRDIEPENVYRFLKAIHKDYTNTEDFLKDYDHYKLRLYHSLKWADAMASGKDPIGQTFLGHIGMGRFLEFIYQDEITMKTMKR